MVHALRFHYTENSKITLLAALSACCAAGHMYVERQRKVAHLGENQYLIQIYKRLLSKTRVAELVPKMK